MIDHDIVIEVKPLDSGTSPRQVVPASWTCIEPSPGCDYLYLVLPDSSVAQVHFRPQARCTLDTFVRVIEDTRFGLSDAALDGRLADDEDDDDEDDDEDDEDDEDEDDEDDEDDFGPRRVEVLEYPGGGKRQVVRGRGRYDLLPWGSIERVARRAEYGAAKYGEDNWRRGLPVKLFIDSAMRHLVRWLNGERDEDHLAAAAWNILALMELTDEEANDGLSIDGE